MASPTAYIAQIAEYRKGTWSYVLSNREITATQANTEPHAKVVTGLDGKLTVYISGNQHDRLRSVGDEDSRLQYNDSFPGIF